MFFFNFFCIKIIKFYFNFYWSLGFAVNGTNHCKLILLKKVYTQLQVCKKYKFFYDFHWLSILYLIASLLNFLSFEFFCLQIETEWICCVHITNQFSLKEQCIIFLSLKLTGKERAHFFYLESFSLLSFSRPDITFF